ncbi:hypothetical protein J4Q44_G00101240 [Coregonus suidteri]|uniref:Uncharacterized protein n=1 Tax=Coregonus suidteri TaxID=861788 RepID=A0AAN8LUJ0_9TELE
MFAGVTPNQRQTSVSCRLFVSDWEPYLIYLFSFRVVGFCSCVCVLYHRRHGFVVCFARVSI